MSVLFSYPIGSTGPIALGNPDPHESPIVPVYWDAEGHPRRQIGNAHIEHDTATGPVLVCEIDQSDALLLTADVADGPLVATNGGGLLYGMLTAWRPAAVAFTAQAITCAVNRAPWATMPIGPDQSWDADAADRRVASACGIDAPGPDAAAWRCYASAHLWRRDGVDPETKGAYGMLLVDVIDGQRRIMPGAVQAAANVLAGGRGGLGAPEDQQAAMRSVLSEIYRRMDAVAPWDRD